MNDFSLIAIFAFAAMAVNSAGIWLLYKNKIWAEKNKEYFMCFAAGILISSSLIMAFPQASEKNPGAGIAALGGFVFMFFSNRLIRHRTKQTELAFGITAIEGIGIHSFIDGAIYSVTFSISLFTGLLAGIGLVAHEFAEGAITFSVLIKAGISPKKAVLYAFFVAALSTPVGAFVAYPFVKFLDDGNLGLALGAVTGVLIYLSASHLLPAVREQEKNHSYLAFIAGISFSLLIMLTKG